MIAFCRECFYDQKSGTGAIQHALLAVLASLKWLPARCRQGDGRFECGSAELGAVLTLCMWCPSPACALCTGEVIEGLDLAV